MSEEIGDFPSEYEHKESIQEYQAEKILGLMGKCLGSKSIYSYDNPKNIVVFNANICTKEYGKIWYGDLDITLSYQKLQELSKLIKTTIYILYENDARFENEINPQFDNAIISFSESGKIEIFNRDYDIFYVDSDGAPRSLSDEEFEEKYPPEPKERSIYNQEDFDPILLPNLKQIRAKKDISPLYDFQKWFIDNYGKEKAEEIYPHLYITPAYNDELESKISKAITKTFPDIHPAKLEQSIAWEMLQAAPSSFMDKPDWAVDGTGYIRKNNK